MDLTASGSAIRVKVEGNVSIDVKEEPKNSLSILSQAHSPVRTRTVTSNGRDCIEILSSDEDEPDEPITYVFLCLLMP